MAKALSVPPPSSFTIAGESVSALSQKWTTWLSRFNIYAAAAGISDDSQKRSLLLHIAGPEVQEVFDTLTDTGTRFDEAVNKLNTHFKPCTNITFQRHVFRKEEQKDSESITQYVVRLKKLADTCNFGDEKDNCIRDQVVDKCKSQSLRKKLLAEKDLTLQKTLEIAQAKEASELQAAQIAEDDKAFAIKSNQTYSHHRKVMTPNNNRLGSTPHSAKSRSTPHNGPPRPPQTLNRQRQGSDITCSRCGLKGHAGHQCRCTQNKTCYSCGKVGHFASMCRSLPPNTTNCLADHMADLELKSEADDCDFIQCSCPDCVYVLGVDRHNTTLFKVGSADISLLIDSGASCNILNGSDSTILKDHGVKFLSCNRTLKPYMSPAIKVTQKLITTIKHENQEIEAEFLVTNGNQPSLLGKSTALKLGVLHVVDQVIEKGLSSPLDLFPGITKGVGKLKNHTVTIDIDPSVPGVARKHSRVPFHIRDKVDAELDRLMKEDIIEKVNSPTKWVSRIVTPPKPKKPDQIRMCVDMREANQCVLRTRHVTPTIDELIADLNGATVMSKIDLRSGYHQLELDPKSRDITTFSTHSGLFRYKRLIFGLNSAAEIFQHTIQELISDIQGAKNVSDDIIVFGVDRESHDKALHATLGRLHESGLTVNEEKCEFYKSEIEFFGFIFSADGLKPDPNKVKALKLAQKPQNLSELRSFLGMVQYSSRFIADFATIVEPLRKS